MASRLAEYSFIARFCRAVRVVGRGHRIACVPGGWRHRLQQREHEAAECRLRLNAVGTAEEMRVESQGRGGVAAPAFDAAIRGEADAQFVCAHRECPQSG
jgi:hypothetical protein